MGVVALYRTTPCPVTVRLSKFIRFAGRYPIAKRLEDMTPRDIDGLGKPRVEKDAGPEALFWRVYVLDEIQGSDPRSVLHHYVRIKIFNERGKEQQGPIDIPYFGKSITFRRPFGRKKGIFPAAGLTESSARVLPPLWRVGVCTRKPSPWRVGMRTIYDFRPKVTMQVQHQRVR